MCMNLHTNWMLYGVIHGFLSAIEASKKKIYNNIAQVEAWLNGAAGNNAGFSDIIKEVQETKSFLKSCLKYGRN